MSSSSSSSASPAATSSPFVVPGVRAPERLPTAAPTVARGETNEDDDDDDDEKSKGSRKGTEPSESPEKRSCAVCDKACTTRCSGCRSVYYCSVDCQRTDWRDRGHRKACRGTINGNGNGNGNGKVNGKINGTGNTNFNFDGATASNRQRHAKPRCPKSEGSAPVAGPKPPVPTAVRNEADAERVLEEFWSILGSAASGDREQERITEMAPPPARRDSSTTVNPGATKSEDQRGTTAKRSPSDEVPSAAGGQKQNPKQNQRASSARSSPLPLPLTLPSPPVPIVSDETKSFVVEEMAQIGSFQLTLALALSPRVSVSVPGEPSIAVATKPLGRAGSRTMVIVRRTGACGVASASAVLFAGEFPGAIEASGISWRIVSSKGATSNSANVNDNANANSNFNQPAASTVDVVFRLPYAYDPSAASAMATAATAATATMGSSSSGGASTLSEINGVLCGSCHQPLLRRNPGRASDRDRDRDVDSDIDSDGNARPGDSNAVSESAIRRVFPLPLGHWDEIADYLICYDGQPVVDFSAGSECAEPSVALQDASLLCFHQRDVEQAVCALAVDGYGEFTEHGSKGNGNGNGNGNGTRNDLGTFATKPQTPFSLGLNEPEPICREVPQPQSSSPSPSPSPSPAIGARRGDANELAREEKDDDDDEPIAPSSAVVRGDRSWQDATDGESVGLCCARCCAPLGFLSLASPETWRFWKHRLRVPANIAVATAVATATPGPARASARRGFEGCHHGVGGATERGNEKTKAESSATTITAADSGFDTLDGAIPATANDSASDEPFGAFVLPSTKPLGSCSSFLARELVRYAESKAIFTFVVRCEDGYESCSDDGTDEETRKDDERCILLRLLSWETTMATSFDDEDGSNNINNNDTIGLDSSVSRVPRSSCRLKFRRVAKIVFEETTDPTVNHHQTHSDASSPAATTQWFWGGVDLCCPPPTVAAATPARVPTVAKNGEPDNRVSTVRLQLPREEYDAVLADLVAGRSCFSKEVADATILLKMGDLWDGLGLAAVALE